MIIIKKELHFKSESDFLKIGPKEQLIFFDIETTGLSAYRAGLYLIGCVSYEYTENIGTYNWILTQFFVESVTDEIPVLKQFFQLLEQKQILIGFNSEGFDLPFLRQLIKQYKLSFSFDRFQSLDLYRMIRPYKKILHLSDCKLKTCERFLGIFREDIFTGGELIYVYQDYLKDKDEKKLHILLLHNAEDLEHLPLLLPLLSYHNFLFGGFQLLHTELITLDTSKVLDLQYRASCEVPVPLDLEYSRFTLNLNADQANLCVHLHEGELKYFYPDYKNYYYLKTEDCAVHKSVGEFVDPQYRCKASAKNCYLRKEGLFLPMLSPVFSPVFLKEYKGKILYTPYSDDLFRDPIKSEAYLSMFRDYILKKDPPESSQNR